MAEPSHRGLANTIVVVPTLPSASDTRIAALIPAGLWTILYSDDRCRALTFLPAAGLAAIPIRFVLADLFEIAFLFNEPPREPRRPFGLSHAACFCSATFA